MRSVRFPAPIVVGLVGLLLASLFALQTLSEADWDPTVFTAFGEDAEPTLVYGEERLGEVITRASQGHDGKFFFVQANDPLLLNPDDNAVVLDRPIYRSQRMLYPLIAGVFGLFDPSVIVWTMLVTNVLAVGFGTAATALTATRMGGNSWWGMAFALNIGLLSELTISGGGLVGAAFAMGGLAALLADRIYVAAPMLAAASLARESLLIMAAGSVLWLLRERAWRHAIYLGAVPVFSVAAWALYVRMRLGWASGVSEVQEVGWPLVGLAQAASDWTVISAVVGLALLTLMIRLAVISLRRPTLLGWATLGFLPLVIVFTRQVWLSYFDISRALAPAITAYFLVAFCRPADERPQVQSPAIGDVG